MEEGAAMEAVAAVAVVEKAWATLIEVDGMVKEVGAGMALAYAAAAATLGAEMGIETAAVGLVLAVVVSQLSRYVEVEVVAPELPAVGTVRTRPHSSRAYSPGSRSTHL